MKNKKYYLLIPAAILVFGFIILPDVSSAAETCGECKSEAGLIAFCNPLQFCTVQDVLGSLLDHLQGIIIAIAIIFIIIGAILYMTSAGDEGRIKTAKAAITAAMIGLAIGVAAPSFLKEISVILGWTPTDPDVTGALSLAKIALNVLNFLLGIIGVLALIMLIVGGITYITAAGDENRIDQGKKIVKYAIVGITIALAALIIVKQIARFFT
jgi:hypothetical protein